MKVRPEKLLTDIKIRANGELPSFWWMQAACWSAYCLVLYITILPFVAQEGGHLNVLLFKVYRSITGFLLSSFLRLFYRRIYAGGGSGQTLLLRPVLAALLGSLVFGGVWGAAEKFYWWLSRHDFDYSHAIASYPRVALVYAITLFAWSALYFGIKYWSNLRTQEEQTLRAQLEMLRYQLNPHFLFNSLNSVRGLIGEDPRRAEKMIIELSEFLRYSLLRDKECETSLEEEIESVRNYLAIEKIRFEDKLVVDYSIEPLIGHIRLPSFLINSLVENAVKYGMQTTALPLRIKLAAHRENGLLRITVSNTGSWVRATSARQPIRAGGAGVGLENVRRRLAGRFPNNHVFEVYEAEGWVHAALKVPVD
jgi:two-component system LytT family sensor kinase